MKLQSIVLFGLAFFCAFSSTALADLPLCFEFQIDANTTTQEVLPTTQTWCYENRVVGKIPTLSIFELDSENQILDRSVVLSFDENKSKLTGMSFSHRYRGELKTETLRDQALNPLPVPLDLNQAIRIAKPVYRSLTSKKEVLESRFIQHFSLPRDLATEVVMPGSYAFEIPNNRFPFNGFWWSQQGLTTAAGENSPLGIFDAHERIRTGRDPASSQWEANHHRGSPDAWGGHCNGWASSAVLYAEPNRTLLDPNLKKVITPYAQKGMLAEASFCAQTAFYGHRYNGPKDDLRDIYPDLFHKVLTYYIRDLKTPVEMDYGRTEMVDNHIITGYLFNISRKSATSVHVDAVVRVAKYDIEQRDSLGPADTYNRHYSYTLVLNSQNQIVSGTWDEASDNPDFMWVTLGAASNCGGANTSIQAQKVVDLIQGLSPAVPRSKVLNQNIQTVIAPQEQIPVEGVEISSADHMRIRFQVQAPSNALMLIVSGAARYPVTGGTEESMFIPIVNGFNDANLDRLTSIESAAIVNQSTTQAYSAKIQFNQFDYLGF
jgi:hypothetical protein